MASVDESLNLIERKVRGLGEAEVSATFIGELVMEELMRLNDVAYVRFASVYRSFTDIESFASEVRRLKQRSSSSNYP